MIYDLWFSDWWQHHVFEYFWSEVATGPISEFQDLIFLIFKYFVIWIFGYFWSEVATGPISEFQDLINCKAFISTVGTIAGLSYQPNYSFRGEIGGKRYILCLKPPQKWCSIIICLPMVYKFIYIHLYIRIWLIYFTWIWLIYISISLDFVEMSGSVDQRYFLQTTWTF